MFYIFNVYRINRYSFFLLGDVDLENMNNASHSEFHKCIETDQLPPEDEVSWVQEYRTKKTPFYLCLVTYFAAMSASCFKCCGTLILIQLTFN